MAYVGILERRVALHEKNAESDKPFTLNKHVREDQWERMVNV
jgi:hypothetical protein